MYSSRKLYYLKSEVDTNVLHPGVNVGVHVHVPDSRGAFEGGPQSRYLETSQQLDGASVLPVHDHGAGPHDPAEAGEDALGEADLATEQLAALPT